MKKLLIIDGSGLLVANYYGTLPAEVQYAKSDEEKEANFCKIAQRNNYYVNAIYPTIKQIFEYAIGYQADYLAVCFDKSRATTFRKDLYNDYKATRKETPNPLKSQFILCEEILSKLGIPVFFHDKYEADDIAGSISKNFASENMETVILSKDKDYLQLVDEFSTVWMMLYKKDAADKKLKQYKLTKEDGYTKYLPEKVIPYNLEIVRKEKGINAKDFSQVLALAGDSVDNIPGVKGVSEETAEKLISYYGSVNALYQDIDRSIISGSVQKLKTMWNQVLDIKRSPYNALIEHRKEAEISVKLAEIKTDINLSELTDNFSLDTLAVVGEIKKDIEESTFLTYYQRNNLYDKINKLIDKKGETNE